MCKFEIVMMGNTAVGKTSMLSALSNELDSFNLSNDLKLEPTSEEFKILHNQWIEMLGQVEAQKPFSTLQVRIEGTAVDFIEHDFDFKVGDMRKGRVVFVDTKGGLTGEYNETLVSRVNQAFGVFCVIDASVMMECPDSTNEKWNCAKTIKRILKDVYSDGDNLQPRFVAFVLTKCETYLSAEKKREALCRKFHEKYGSIITMLHGIPTPPAMYCLAIRTMCGVKFHELNNEGLPEFRVCRKKATLETKDCAYPLVILLQNLIRDMDEHTSLWHKILASLGLAKSLRSYLDELDDNFCELPKVYEEL